MRQFSLERPSWCGCCRRPVHLVESPRSVTLVEHQDGEQVPHVCPDEAVEAWARVRRLIRLRNRARTE